MTTRGRYPQLNAQQCAQFLANPNINPVDPTKRLLPNKGPYNDFVRQCGQPRSGFQSPQIPAFSNTQYTGSQVGLGGLSSFVGFPGTQLNQSQSQSQSQFPQINLSGLSALGNPIGQATPTQLPQTGFNLSQLPQGTAQPSQFNLPQFGSQLPSVSPGRLPSAAPSQGAIISSLPQTGQPQFGSQLPSVSPGRLPSAPPSQGGIISSLPQTGQSQINLPQFTSQLPSVSFGQLPSATPSQGGVISNLPQTGQFGLPQTGQPQFGLPQTGQFGLPQTGQFGLPQTGQFGLPQTGQFGLPQTGQPQFGLPQTGQPRFGLPQTGQLTGISVSATPSQNLGAFAQGPSVNFPSLQPTPRPQISQRQVPPLSPGRVGRNILVVYHEPDSTILYLVPVDEETNDLVQDLLSINGLYRGRDVTDTEQDTIFENLEGDLIDYRIEDLLRLVNLNGVTIVDIGDVSGEEPGSPQEPNEFNALLNGLNLSNYSSDEE
jgi:hypothetical protein